jgi:small subunit ribosomal protein S4e
MANKGETKSEKRLASSKAVPVLRKEHTWQVRSKPGPHKRRNSVALEFVLRDLLGFARNSKEVRGMLNAGMVLVDGRIVKNRHLPVGLFDLVSIGPEKKCFRVLFSRKGKIKAVEEDFSEKRKICKVVGKKVLSKGVVQLATNDGRTFLEKKSETKVGDSLLVEVPEQKISKVLKLEPNKMVLVVDGTHVGDVAKLLEVLPGSMLRPKLVKLKTGSGEFRTVESNIFVVGEEKPLVKVE